MRKIMFFALAATVCLSVQANEWKKFVPTAYLLSPAEDSKIVAMANLNGDTINVSLIDFSGSFCTGTQNANLSEAGPYKVNGTYLKFVQACINGNRVLSPETPKGKEFFAKALTTAPATTELDLGVILHFTSQNFESAKKAMMDTRSAM
ncbi:hypothetical protein [Pseudomonas amygdali]|uniref:hypothetical protein n=1 Tax=Pseudomonas amygdali TaxID=47877 RepID=UPI0006B95AFE|nr:hypothetical protein [Pseudomonas amygdali]